MPRAAHLARPPARRAALTCLALAAPCACSNSAPAVADALDVPVVVDALEPVDAPGGPDVLDAAPPTDASPSADAGTALLRFGVFGDVRPPDFNDTAHYPTDIVSSVMTGMTTTGAQFAIGTGDYMFAYDNSAAAANAQLDLLLAAERAFPGPIYHAMGNHECTTASDSNCPLGTESALITAYRTRLIPTQPAVYFDWTVVTPMGDAHFIVTAPNAWSAAQASWLDGALARRATYTFVVAHEPPTSFTVPPGTAAIAQAVATRATPVTMSLYGHVHYYRHTGTNAVVVGNAGAPLSGTSSGAIYGFVIVEQRPDGDLAVTAYEIGSPPMVHETFVLRPDGTAGG